MKNGESTLIDIIDIKEIIERLEEKYGEDFTWFIPEKLEVFDKELQAELTDEHPLKGIKLRAAAKNEINDDVLFLSAKTCYIVHLTWNRNEIKGYPKFIKVEYSKLEKYLEEDYLLA